MNAAAKAQATTPNLHAVKFIINLHLIVWELVEFGYEYHGKR